MKSDINKKQWLKFFQKIILPAILSITLFIILLFAILIPSFEKNIMERKKEMIRELTNSAWSILEKHYKDESDSIVTREEAQKKAIEEIKYLRYGDKRKDYFWINDMGPNMIMHPYRSDLDGKSLSEFKDYHGKKLFVEILQVVKKNQEGYVDYMWQWKDDSTHIVPKLSFVKEFKPWEWIIGTGIYIEDVKAEIKKMESRVITVSIIITLIIALLLTINMRQSINIERKRQQAESDLKLSRERYRALVEASTEGSLMVMDNYIYANKTLLDQLEYDEQQISTMNIYEIVMDEKLKEKMPEFDDMVTNLYSPIQRESKLRKSSGELINVMMNISKISIAGKNAVIFIIKDISDKFTFDKQKDEYLAQYKGILDRLNIGCFKSILARRSTFIEANSVTASILGFTSQEELLKTHIEDIFYSNEERKDFVRELLSKGSIRNRIVKIMRYDSMPTYILVSLFIVEESSKGEKICEGIVEDITEKYLMEKNKESLMNKIQASQSLIYNPVSNLVKEIITCDLKTPVKQVAILMTKFNTDTIFVSNEQGDILGVVTDQDIRKRVVAKEETYNIPVYKIMTAPIAVISKNALLHEAMFSIREIKSKFIGVKDEFGKIINILTIDEIFNIINYVPEVLIKQIQIAQTITDLENIQKEINLMIRYAFETGVNPQQITRIISSVSDSVIDKLNKLAQEELGPAPVKYVFIILGSVGREEQTMATDQDNAIIYEDVQADKEEETKTYFLKLGKKVCTWLNHLGYYYCQGNIMAQNPRFCQPLAIWKKYFYSWVTTSEPQDLLDFNIFFDFRPVSGEIELGTQLKQYLNKVIENNPAFFYHLAANALSIKPPLNFFGNIIKESSPQHSNTLDIKKAMMPIIGYSRLYALKNKIDECNTVARIKALNMINVIQDAEQKKIIQMYDSLMRMRLQHQIDQMKEGKTPDNYINAGKLTELDQVILKKVFSMIGYLQSKISYDFKITSTS